MVTSGWDLAGWMIAAGLVMMVDQSGNAFAALRVWGGPRYIGGAKEAYPERIGAFWWRLRWVKDCVVTCNESKHGKCYDVCLVGGLSHY